MQEIRLGKLGRRACEQLAAAALGADAGLVARVVDQSGGNPFFLLETVRSLIETGVLVKGQGGWAAAAGAMTEAGRGLRVLLARMMPEGTSCSAVFTPLMTSVWPDSDCASSGRAPVNASVSPCDLNGRS